VDGVVFGVEGVASVTLVLDGLVFVEDSSDRSSQRENKLHFMM